MKDVNLLLGRPTQQQVLGNFVQRASQHCKTILSLVEIFAEGQNFHHTKCAGKLRVFSQTIFTRQGR
jgi:hypothetical protein